METFTYLLFIILACSYCQKAEGGQGLIYYVTATGADCPLVHQHYCQSLSDYANQSHWPTESNNVTFLFLPGEHSFKDKFKIKGVSYVTLRGIESQFQSRAMINCEEVKITNITTLYIENLKFNYYPNSILLYKVDTAHLFKVSAQFLSVIAGYSLNILQSEFIAHHRSMTWTAIIDVSDIMNAVVLKDTLISGGDCLSVFTYSECFHMTINDTIMSCSAGNGISIFNTYDKESDYPESTDIILSNVTSISRNSSTSIYVDHLGKIKLIDIQVLSIHNIMLISTFGEISLTRVFISNAEDDLSIFTKTGQIALTDVSVANSGGLYIDYCSSCTLTNVHVSNSSYGIIVENTKEAISLVNCTIANNRNTGLRVKGQAKLAFLTIPSHIVNNTSPGNGGGIWISQGISISFSTQVYITHNVAMGVGGAIYAYDEGFEDIYLFCTLRYWYRSNSTFHNNYGKLGGNNIYGGTYWDCCYRPFGRAIKVKDCPHLAKSEKKFNNQMKCHDNILFHTFSPSFFQPSLIASNPIGVCICLNDGTTNCNIREINIELYPSESVHLSLATVGVCGGFSPGELVTSKGNYIDVLLQDTNQETSGKHSLVSCRAPLALFYQKTNVSVAMSLGVLMEHSVASIGCLIPLEDQAITG
uniref:Periplasmic copper-binding protein NosD beta helix domain-containing protein n=1 Tax=Amphimedon queenslandica TaxID=400682 RepID=A0A1X7VPT6_AMPQE